MGDRMRSRAPATRRASDEPSTVPDRGRAHRPGAGQPRTTSARDRTEHDTGGCYHPTTDTAQAVTVWACRTEGRCPAESINVGEDGRVLVHCHARCDTRDVL